MPIILRNMERDGFWDKAGKIKEKIIETNNPEILEAWQNFLAAFAKELGMDEEHINYHVDPKEREQALPWEDSPWCTVDSDLEDCIIARIDKLNEKEGEVEDLKDELEHTLYERDPAVTLSIVLKALGKRFSELSVGERQEILRGFTKEGIKGFNANILLLLEFATLQFHSVLY